MSYKIYEGFAETIKGQAIQNIDSVEGMDCPTCGSPLWYVDQEMSEEYMADGSFERTERFYCEQCNTFADVTQVYRMAERRVKVMRDVFDNEGGYRVETLYEG